MWREELAALRRVEGNGQGPAAGYLGAWVDGIGPIRRLVPLCYSSRAVT